MFETAPDAVPNNGVHKKPHNPSTSLVAFFEFIVSRFSFRLSQPRPVFRSVPLQFLTRMRACGERPVIVASPALALGDSFAAFPPLMLSPMEE
jgi:hypothetical protein